MLKAFFDESIHDSMVCVAGFVGREDQWLLVEQECEALFTSLNVPYLHMTELMGYESTAYKHLSHENRKTLIADVAAIARRYLPLQFSVLLDGLEYKSGTSDRFRSQMGSAYTMCATSAVLLVGDMLRREEIEWNVFWTFERGHASRDQLSTRLTVLHESVARFLRIQNFGFSPIAEDVMPEIPLQVADMAAYSALQPNDCLGAMEELLAAQPGDILQHREITLTSDLAIQMWGPMAELEASVRKKRRLASRFKRIASGLPAEDGIYEMTDEEAQQTQIAVKRLNEICRTLGFEERVTLVEHDLAEDGMMN
jgi:hypothetical protein